MYRKFRVHFSHNTLITKIDFSKVLILPRFALSKLSSERSMILISSKCSVLCIPNFTSQHSGFYTLGFIQKFRQYVILKKGRELGVNIGSEKYLIKEHCHFPSLETSSIEFYYINTCEIP